MQGNKSVQGTMRCDVGEPYLEHDVNTTPTSLYALLDEAGISDRETEVLICEGMVLIKTKGADREDIRETLLVRSLEELVAMVAVSEIWPPPKSWTPAERGLVFCGPYDSAEGTLQVSAGDITINITRNADGGSGYLSAEQLQQFAADSGITPGTPVRIFFFGPGSLGKGVGIHVCPLEEG